MNCVTLMGMVFSPVFNQRTETTSTIDTNRGNMLQELVIHVMRKLSF